MINNCNHRALCISLGVLWSYDPCTVKHEASIDPCIKPHSGCHWIYRTPLNLPDLFSSSRLFLLLLLHSTPQSTNIEFWIPSNFSNVYALASHSIKKKEGVRGREEEEKNASNAVLRRENIALKIIYCQFIFIWISLALFYSLVDDFTSLIGNFSMYPEVLMTCCIENNGQSDRAVGM